MLIYNEDSLWCFFSVPGFIQINWPLELSHVMIRTYKSKFGIRNLTGNISSVKLQGQVTLSWFIIFLAEWLSCWERKKKRKIGGWFWSIAVGIRRTFGSHVVTLMGARATEWMVGYITLQNCIRWSKCLAQQLADKYFPLHIPVFLSKQA